MRSIPLALTWEMLARGRWQLPLMTLGALLLPVLVYSALASQGALSPADSAFIIMHFALVQVNMFTFGAGLMQSLGPISRLYAYPARTSTLVAWQLLPAMALMMLEMLGVSALLNALYDVAWPLWAPSLFAAVALAAVLAVMWLTEKSAWLPWSVGLVAAALGMWFKSRHGALFGEPTHYWEVVTVIDGVTLLLIAAASYAVAVYGVSLRRRGDSLPAWGIWARLERMSESEAIGNDRFASPAAAQLWFEWRKKGWAMPACVVFVFTLWGTGWLIFSRDARTMIEGLCIGGGSVMCVLGLVCGLILGECGTRNHAGIMSQFLATRPLSNSRLARIMLWNSAKSVGTAWLIWAIPSALISVILIATGVVQRSEVDPFLLESWWWYVPATLIGAWSISTCLAAMLLVGRQRLMFTLMLAGFALLIGLNVMSAFTLTHEQQLVYWKVVFLLIAGLVVGGTGTLFVLARRRRLIDTPTVWASITAWCLLIAGLIAGQVYDSGLNVAASLFVGGVMGLAIAPFAATPLALALNRTR